MTHEPRDLCCRTIDARLQPIFDSLVQAFVCNATGLLTNDELVTVLRRAADRIERVTKDNHHIDGGS